MLEQFFFLFGFFCSVFVICGVLMSPFFLVWEKKVHTLKGQGAHFLNCFLLVHIAFFPSSSSIIKQKEVKKIPRGELLERGDEDLKEPRKSIK